MNRSENSCSSSIAKDFKCQAEEVAFYLRACREPLRSGMTEFVPQEAYFGSYVEDWRGERLEAGSLFRRLSHYPREEEVVVAAVRMERSRMWVIFWR